MTKPLTIYVVEDDAELREFVESLLGGDYCVVTFASGLSALKALRTVTPDVLVSDLELKDMAGEDVAEETRRLRKRTRIVLMSGNHLRLQRARPLADSLLRKPFSIPELTVALGAEHDG